jgi:hypothetical protein
MNLAVVQDSLLKGVVELVEEVEVTEAEMITNNIVEVVMTMDLEEVEAVMPQEVEEVILFKSPFNSIHQ